jgi:hypothetical protein
MHSLRQYCRVFGGNTVLYDLIVIIGENNNKDDLLTSLMGEMEQDRELDSAMSRTHKLTNSQTICSPDHTLFMAAVHSCPPLSQLSSRVFSHTAVQLLFLICSKQQYILADDHGFSIKISLADIHVTLKSTHT